MFEAEIQRFPSRVPTLSGLASKHLCVDGNSSNAAQPV